MPTVNPREFNLQTPAIFHGLPVRYGETRRDLASKEPMSGSTTESMAIIESAYTVAHPKTTETQTDWSQERLVEARTRVEHLRRLLGFQAGLALARPVHGTDLLDLSTPAFRTAQSIQPLQRRAPADATINRVPQRGSQFNPADCPVSNIAFYRAGEVLATAQIHTGWKGLVNNLIGKTLRSLADQDLLPTQAVTYVSPHARRFTVHGTALEAIKSASLEQYLSGPTHEPVFDLTALTIDQLHDGGISPANIEVSPLDSMTEPTLYSHYNHTHNPQAPIGRNGIAFGIAIKNT